MIKFNIGEDMYELPTFINVDHYTKIYKIKDLFSEDYFAARLISIVTGAPMDKLLENDYQEITYMAAHILSLLPIDHKIPFVDRFELDGVHYGFFPNWKDLSFAEFVDMDTISTKRGDEMLELLHILAAVMYRPIVEEKSEHDFKIEKYDVKTMQERAELFKYKLDCKYILGAQLFFFNYARTFTGYSQLSLIPKLSIWTKLKLMWRMRKMITEIVFKRSSGGTWSSTELLEMILQSTSTSTKRK
jgi:hypothetical protein